MVYHGSAPGKQALGRAAGQPGLQALAWAAGQPGLQALAGQQGWPALARAGPAGPMGQLAFKPSLISQT